MFKNNYFSLLIFLFRANVIGFCFENNDDNLEYNINYESICLKLK